MLSELLKVACIMVEHWFTTPIYFSFASDDLRDNLINESWMESHQVDECVKWFVANEDIQIIKTIKK